MRTAMSILAWVAAIGVGLSAATAGDPKDAEKSAQAYLASQVGVWDAEMTVLEGPPGQEKPPKSKGVETNTMLAGKWLISDFKGDFGGMPFEGHGVTGFDAKKGKIIGTWIDTMSKTIDSMEGSYDEASKTYTCAMEGIDPQTDKPYKAKMVNVVADKDSHTFSYYSQSEGSKEYTKVFEIVYKRKAR